MPLFVYRANSADHTHENLQFLNVCKMLKERFGGKEDFCLYVPNYRCGTRNFDGLIVKRNAIIVLEFKSHSDGTVTASENATWTFREKNKPRATYIDGGAANNVTEQAEKNVRQALGTFNKKFFCQGLKFGKDVHSLVCFNTNVKIVNQLNGATRQWLNICSMESFMETLDVIASPNIDMNLAGLFDIIKREGFAEVDLNTDYSDVDCLPHHLFDPSNPHDHDVPIITPGSIGLTPEEVAQIKKENEELRKKIEENSNYLLQAKTTIAEITVLLQQSIDNNREKDDFLLQLQIALEAQQKRMEELENTISEQEQQLKGLQDTAIGANVDIYDEPSPISGRTPRKSGNRRRLKPFCVGFDDVNADDEEARAICTTMDKPLIVTGCAGSGKSIIALYKAKQIQDAGCSYMVIVFNNTLKAYMSAGFEELKLTGRVYTFGDWETYQHPMADYIIVDEAQDFSIDEIRALKAAARKQMFFFGDSNQSIYQNLKQTTSMEELCREFGVDHPLELSNCYRLPKAVAALLPAVKPDIEYVEGRYKNENANAPFILPTESLDEQLDLIKSIIEKGKLKEVGILLPNNKMVREVAALMTAKGVEVEMRYRGDDVEQKKEFDTLNFNHVAPKLMTYHSAKGLQFETVILPLCPSFRSDADKKLLYVALTRTYRNLYIMYSGPMPAPLSAIDSSLYSASL